MGLVIVEEDEDKLQLLTSAMALSKSLEVYIFILDKVLR